MQNEHVIEYLGTELLKAKLYYGRYQQPAGHTVLKVQKKLHDRLVKELNLQFEVRRIEALKEDQQQLEFSL